MAFEQGVRKKLNELRFLERTAVRIKLNEFDDSERQRLRNRVSVLVPSARFTQDKDVLCVVLPSEKEYESAFVKIRNLMEDFA
jgi:hypothetical protein